MKAEPDVLS